MKPSLPYYLSWIGLIGVISSQVIIIVNQQSLTIWPSIVLIMALLPIKGFIQHHRYTYQWTGFLSLLFLCVGVSGFFEVAKAESSSFILLCSSIILYFGVVFHAKKLGYYEAVANANQQ